MESRNGRPEPRPRTRPSCRRGASSLDGSARGKPSVSANSSSRMRKMSCCGSCSLSYTLLETNSGGTPPDAGAAGNAPLLLYPGADHHELTRRRLGPHPQQHAIELEVLMNAAADLGGVALRRAAQDRATGDALHGLDARLVLVDETIPFGTAFRRNTDHSGSPLASTASALVSLRSSDTCRRPRRSIRRWGHPRRSDRYP